MLPGTTSMVKRRGPCTGRRRTNRLPPFVPGGNGVSEDIGQPVCPRPAFAQIAFPCAQDIGTAIAAHRNKEAQYLVNTATGYPRQDVAALGAAANGYAEQAVRGPRMGPRLDRPVTKVCPAWRCGRHDQIPRTETAWKRYGPRPTRCRTAGRCCWPSHIFQPLDRRADPRDVPSAPESAPCDAASRKRRSLSKWGRSSVSVPRDRAA